MFFWLKRMHFEEDWEDTEEFWVADKSSLPIILVIQKQMLHFGVHLFECYDMVVSRTPH